MKSEFHSILNHIESIFQWACFGRILPWPIESQIVTGQDSIAIFVVSSKKSQNVKDIFPKAASLGMSFSIGCFAIVPHFYIEKCTAYLQPQQTMQLWGLLSSGCFLVEPLFLYHFFMPCFFTSIISMLEKRQESPWVGDHPSLHNKLQPTRATPQDPESEGIGRGEKETDRQRSWIPWLKSI